VARFKSERCAKAWEFSARKKKKKKKKHRGKEGACGENRTLPTRFRGGWWRYPRRSGAVGLPGTHWFAAISHRTFHIKNTAGRQGRKDSVESFGTKSWDELVRPAFKAKAGIRSSQESPKGEAPKAEELRGSAKDD